MSNSLQNHCMHILYQWVTELNRYQCSNCFSFVKFSKSSTLFSLIFGTAMATIILNANEENLRYSETISARN